VTYDRTVWITLPVQVEFSYQPYEPPERGPEAQYPGCAESIDLIRVRVGDQDITRRLTDEDMASIEDAVWQELEALSD
jgi:hypothetical protein